jgi:hypothetical protein
MLGRHHGCTIMRVRAITRPDMATLSTVGRVLLLFFETDKFHTPRAQIMGTLPFAT